MLGFFSRFLGVARAVWLSDGGGGKPYLIELTAHVYAGPKYAQRMRSRNLPNMETITRLIDPPPTIIRSPANRLVIQWQRDSLHFREISGVHANAVVAALAVASERVDAASVLDDLWHDVESRLEVRGFPASGAIPPQVWELLIGVPLGLIAWILATVVGEALGEPVGWVMFAAFIAVTLFSLSIWPRILRRRSRLERNWRLALTQGDNDGTIRRALASIGIELPEAPAPSP